MARAVKHIPTGRLVYRQSPDFEWGNGIPNAIALTGFLAGELEEVEVTETEWDAEIALREQERSRTDREILEANIVTETPNPNKEAFKLSVLYGKTYQQVLNYVGNKVDSLTSLSVEDRDILKDLLQLMARLEFWLYKQIKLDE